MKWVTLDDDSILSTYLAASQVTAIRTAKVQNGQADPYLEIMEAVVKRIRVNIARVGKPVSQTDLSIPPEVKDYAVLLILDRMSLRLPTLALTEDQRRQVREAQEFIKTLGDPMVAVSMPDDPMDPDVFLGGGVTTVETHKRHATPKNMDGL